MLADAIMAHQLGWFCLAKFKLLLALESAENISTEAQYLGSLQKAAKNIDLDRLIKELDAKR